MIGRPVDRPLRHAAVACALAASATAGGCRPTAAHAVAGAALNVQLVGYTDLDNRPGRSLAIREVGGRWLLYLGHVWEPGWSIVDVTNPGDPRVVRFTAGPANTITGDVELHGQTLITAIEPVDARARADEGFAIWDLGDPTAPRQLGRYQSGGGGTHRNFYAGGRYVHASVAAPEYAGWIYEIVDIQDPAHPVEVGRWSPPEQHPADEPRAGTEGLSGRPTVVKDLAYLPYASAGMYVLDIGDVTRPRLVGHLPCARDGIGASDVNALQVSADRKVAFASAGPGGDSCSERSPQAWAIDVSDPACPSILGVFPRPKPERRFTYTDFCDKGGRFGAAGGNDHQHSADVERQGDLFYMAYLNAGLRIFNVKDPRQPREVGYFVPPDPLRWHGSTPPATLAAQVEDVLVDRRGYIYLTEKNQGLWVLRYAGTS